MDIIERAILKFGSASAVARELGVTPGFVYQMRDKKRAIPPYHAGKLAELLELNPAEIVFQTLEEQAGKKDEREKWHEWRKYLAATLAVAFVAAGLSGHSPQSHASESPSYSAGSNASHSIQCVHGFRRRRHGSRGWLRSQPPHVDRMKQRFNRGAIGPTPQINRPSPCRRGCRASLRGRVQIAG